MMSQNPDFSEVFYRKGHAQRYAEVSHGFVQSIYTNASHPGLKGDMDLMDRLLELFPPPGLGVWMPAAGQAPATYSSTGRRVTTSTG